MDLHSGGGETESLEVRNSAQETCSMLVQVGKPCKPSLLERYLQVFRKHKLRCNPNLCDEGVRGRCGRDLDCNVELYYSPTDWTPTAWC